MLTLKERKLIAALRKNGRQNIKNMAIESNLPASTMYDLLHKLEENGILEHKSKVAFDKIGYPTRIWVAVKTVPANREVLKQHLMKNPNVNNVFRINSGFDFHFEGVFRNQKDALDFLEALEHEHQIVQKNVYTVIDTIQHESFLTEEEHFDV